jgi:hypothetical protein
LNNFQTKAKKKGYKKKKKKREGNHCWWTDKTSLYPCLNQMGINKKTLGSLHASSLAFL